MSAEARETRIPIGPLIGLAGALLLLVSLFLDWWEGLTAFTVFEALDLVLALLALGAILSLAGPLGAGLPEGAAPRRELALPLGLAALVIVASQLVNNPPLVVGTERGPEVGLWLALGGSALMLAGGLLSVLRISLALDLEPRRPRRAERAEPTTGEVPDTPTARRAERTGDRPATEPTEPLGPPD